MTDTKTGTLREAIAGIWTIGGQDAADAVLALPELAAVIADADNWRRVTTGDPTEPEPLAMQARTLLVRCRELEATVARVRGLAERFADLARTQKHRAEECKGDAPATSAMIAGFSGGYQIAADYISEALDGEPQP